MQKRDSKIYWTKDVAAVMQEKKEEDQREDS